jgi:hypothetical protein
MPFAFQTRGNPVTCDDRFYPNGNGQPDAADPEINVTSHEHNEAITDPFGTGWWDSNPNDADAGEETGDMCAYVWGTLYGTPAPTINTPAETVAVPGSGIYNQQWNQSINGHHYIAQQEWSSSDEARTNAAGSPDGCVSSETPQLTLTPNIGYPTAPFKVTGLFFGANDPVSFSFTSAGSSTPETLASTTADSSGRTKIMTAVPGDAQPGNAAVSGTGAGGGGSYGASFTVPSP